MWHYSVYVALSNLRIYFLLRNGQDIDTSIQNVYQYRIIMLMKHPFKEKKTLNKNNKF